MDKSQRLSGQIVLSTVLDRRLRTYLAAAGGASTFLVSQAEAVVVSNTTPQSFGINQEVNIDFNMDGQIDFQIDHDRINVGGSILDYLQVDKNDASSAANPRPIDNFGTFPLNGTQANGDAQYLSFTNSFGDQGGYAVALNAGDMIGAAAASSDGLVPGTLWDFQEGNSFLGSQTTIRANRLIDEDAGQFDISDGKAVTVPFGTQPEFPALDDFLGNNGETRYVGVRVDLNDMGKFGLNDGNMPNQWWYGWIGIQIDNEADATGKVTGWAYESTMGMPIEAGDIGPPMGLPGDFDNDNDVDGRDFLIWQRGNTNPPLDATALSQWQSNYGNPLLANTAAIPEPGSLLMAAMGGFCVLGGFAARRLFPSGKSNR